MAKPDSATVAQMMIVTPRQPYRSETNELRREPRAEVGSLTQRGEVKYSQIAPKANGGKLISWALEPSNPSPTTILGRKLLSDQRNLVVILLKLRTQTVRYS